MYAVIEVPQLDQEPVASVLRVLQLTPRSALAGFDATFAGRSLPQARRIYGGQVVAQALLAAAATIADPDRLPHSLHAYFLRGGDPSGPLDFNVLTLRDGGSFSARSVTAQQKDRELLVMNASFHAAEDGLQTQAEPPEVVGPDRADSALALFRDLDHPVAKFLGKTAAFDVRHVQKSLYVGPAPARETTQQLWMKPRTPIRGASQVVERALLAYVVDQVMLEPSLRSVGLHWSTPGMSLASLDHAMWFHRDVDINDWLLFDGNSVSVGGGRAKADIRIFSRSGELVASAAQEGMVRVPAPGEKQGGRWTFSD